MTCNYCSYEKSLLAVEERETIMYNPTKCRSFTFLLTISICFWTSYAQSENSVPPEVTIPQGTLQGVILTSNHQRNFSGFLAIPYAQPPVGDLRFANPIRATDRWNGTRDSSVEMNMCPQIDNDVISGDEDCLYINVYTPQLPESTNASLLPVMVYIHGGRFRRGTARSDRRSPKYLLDEDVVLAIPNHRIGPLGFLSTGDGVASGNWGLKDMVLALEWVQDNIKYFGGDPDRVTLFGQSSGATSVHLLTLSDSTIGLFHRYIMQSGSAHATWAYQPRATYASRSFELGEYVGCSNDTSASLITCLRAVNSSDIIATYSQFLVWRSQPTIVWTPTDEPDIEGALLTDSPANLFANGKIRDLPWINGVVRDEGLIFTAELYEDEEVLNELLENLDAILPDALSITYQSDSGAAWVNAIESYYLKNNVTINNTELLTNLTLLISDALMFYPAYKGIQQHLASAESPAYFYTFNYRGTYSNTLSITGSMVNYGVTHGDDFLYLLGIDSVLGVDEDSISVSEDDMKMVDIMVQLWTSFAINGTPTTSALDGNTIWEPYSKEDNYLRIGNESDLALETRYSFHKERMQFWADLTSDSVCYCSTPFVIALLICFRLVV